MAQSVIKLQSSLMREYYKYFSKYARGKTPDKKVAWVTAFTPVEILEALGISYYYPESYAAVIAASEKEQPLLAKSEQCFLCRDCCSYSCCIEGCLELEDGPRGTPPKPDILIATNNQCNTLPDWWNILSARYNVPLIVIDYPGESVPRERAFEYVNAQHTDLIARLEELSGNKFDKDVLANYIDKSSESVYWWKKVAGILPEKAIGATTLFDDISYLITARCDPDTAELYKALYEEAEVLPETDKSLIPLFWLGYPLWYHPDRYLSECLDGFRICGSNYITWWDLDYCGNDVYEKLFSAYNYTFLNLLQETRTERLTELIKTSGAKCAVTLHNKSCKCDFVSAKDIGIPQAELEIDMIDRSFLSVEKAKKQIDLLKETICTQ